MAVCLVGAWSCVLALGASAQAGPTLNQTFEGEEALGRLGHAVASGDFDGDGILDLVLGAPRTDNEDTDGRVYVYYSSNLPRWEGVGQKLYGAAVAAGDVNGDGVDDLLIGAQRITSPLSAEGAVFLYLGAEDTGLGDDGHPSNGDWEIAGQQAGAELGQSIATADVNGDGFDDLLVGAYQYNGGNSTEGAVFVYLGGTSLLPENVDSKPLGTPSNADWRARANQTGAYFGESLASAGDVNGDGYDDIIVGALEYNDGGLAFLFLGSPCGPLPKKAGGDWVLAGNGENAWASAEGSAGGQFGQSVSGAGDVNGDGYDDLIVGGTQGTGGTSGEARLYLGTAATVNCSGCPSTCSTPTLSLTNPWTVQGTASASLGWSVASAGDVNGDGYDDALVGAENYSEGPAVGGRALLYMGGPQGLGPRAPWTTVGVASGDQLGYRVAGVGDLDLDGFADFVVGAPGFDNAQSNAGAARVFHGGQQPGQVLHQVKISQAAPGFPETLGAAGQFGAGVAALGDVDGDSVVDLAVTAISDDDGGTDRGAVWIVFMNRDGSARALQKISALEGGFTPVLDDGDQFGSSVAAIGKLDGDSIPDMVVGARGDDDAGTDAGAVYIVYLNADGTAKAGSPKISEGFVGGGGLAAGDWFGYSVCGLGDLDGAGGDAYVLAVGARGDDDDGDEDDDAIDQGSIWILRLSSAGGVNQSHEIGSVIPLANGDLFGSSIANLGDTDAAGTSAITLAVGAQGDDSGGADAGAVWLVFLNSNWSVFSYNEIAEGQGDFPGDLSVGDVFGSGLSSLDGLDPAADAAFAVGAYGTAGGRGGVWVVTIDVTTNISASTGTVTSAGLIAEGSQGFLGDLDSNDFFGAVSAPGDLNGDGVVDLFIGAPLDDDGSADTGAVWVCYLGAFGTRTTHWTGAVSTAWELDANWTNGVPDATTTAVIVDQTNDPLVSATGQACMTLFVQPEAILTIGSGIDLDLHGGATVFGPSDPQDGDAVEGLGRLVFVEDGILAGEGRIDLSVVVANYDLEVQGGPIVIVGANGELHLNGGDLLVGGTLIVARVTIGSAVFSRSSGAGTISVVFATPFGGILEIDASSETVILDGILTGEQALLKLVSGDLQVLPGSVAAKVSVEAGALLDVGSADLTIPGDMDVDGELRIGPGGVLVLGIDETSLVPPQSQVLGTTTIRCGGRLTLLGTLGNPAVLTSDEPTGFDLVWQACAAELMAQDFEITTMSVTGFPIPATVDVLELRRGVFDRTAVSGRLLDVERPMPSRFTYLTFRNTSGSASASNVRVLAGSPVTFAQWSGPFGGEVFDDDAGEPGGPELVLWVTRTRAR